LKPLILQIVSFAGVGLLNTAIDFGALSLLLHFHMPLLVANTLAFLLAVVNSYFMNKYWTFGAKEPGGWMQFVKFLIIATVGLFFSDLIVGVLVLAFDLWLTFAKVLSVVIVVSWNFVASKYLVFDQP
jgi:putative flippase GtrA